MTLIDALVLFAFVAACAGAGVYQLWLYVSHHPRRWLYAWAGWTALAAPGITILSGRTGESMLSALFLGVALGPLVYPVLWALMYLQTLRYRHRDDDAVERERLRYYPTDFAAGQRAARPALTRGVAVVTTHEHPGEPTLVTQPTGSALAEVSAERRPWWHHVAELGLIGAIGVAAVAFYVGAPLAGGSTAVREVVVSELEAEGFAGVRLKRQWITIYCPHRREGAYRWSAAGAAGRACGDYDHAHVWVDQTWRRPGDDP